MAKVATKTVNEEKGLVVFDFTNNESIKAALKGLPPETVTRLALHGLSQKMGDSYASAESVEAAVLSATNTYAQLKKGVWTAGRSSSGGQIVDALARATGKKVEECRTVISGMDEDAIKELRKHPQVKAALAAIRSEREAEKAKASGAELKGLF